VTEGKGDVIVKACEVLRATYRAVGNLRDDFASLLKDQLPSMDFEVSEYSYGGASLWVRGNHTIAYERKHNKDDPKTVNHLLVLHVIFFDDDSVSPVASGKEPELWAGALRVEESSYSNAAYRLEGVFKTTDQGKWFERLALDGKSCGYSWPKKPRKGEESWRGQWVGNSLVSVSAVGKAKTMMLDKLLPAFQQLVGEDCGGTGGP